MSITSIKPDNGGGEANARACLGGTYSWCTDGVSGPGSQTDASNGQMEGLRGQTDAPNVLNGAETAVVRPAHAPGAWRRRRTYRCARQHWKPHECVEWAQEGDKH